MLPKAVQQLSSPLCRWDDRLSITVCKLSKRLFIVLVRVFNIVVRLSWVIYPASLLNAPTLPGMAEAVMNPLLLVNWLVVVGTMIFTVWFVFWLAVKVPTLEPFFCMVSVALFTVGMVGLLVKSL